MPSATSSTPTASPAVSDACIYGHAANGTLLPDRRCTPGALNPAVTQATIGSTICVKGWTATVRPPVSWTSKVKTEMTRAYGRSTGSVGELDHLIPLELGGAPAARANLWFEPGSIPNPKDRVENTLRAAVCAGSITLAQAQREIAPDWTTAG